MADCIYLDYMATTPILADAIEAMRQAMGEQSDFANPSSTHTAGQAAARRVEKARQQVATAIGAQPEALFWTSGATESNNLAIQGAAHFYARQGKHLITLETEHKAVSAVMEALERDGFEVTYLKPKPNGLICLDALEAAIRPDTRLISLMWVNNETGVIQPIDAVARCARRHGVLLHVDAAQALGKISIDLAVTPIDLLSLSGHKCYGPKGVGVLFIRQQPRVRLSSIIHGGSQEGAVRSGTVPTHQVAGMGESVECVLRDWDEEQARIAALSAQLREGLAALPGVVLLTDPLVCVPHCVAVAVADISMNTLLSCLPDLAISTGSACNSATLQPSPVLVAMGIDPLLAENACRVSIGRFVTERMMQQALERFEQELRYLRGLSPLVSDPCSLSLYPFQHAAESKDFNCESRWESLSIGVALVLRARIDCGVIEQVSYKLSGPLIWFEAAELFCAKLAGQTLAQLLCWSTTELLEHLAMSGTQRHVANAFLLAAQQWKGDDKKSF